MSNTKLSGYVQGNVNKLKSAAHKLQPPWQNWAGVKTPFFPIYHHCQLQQEQQDYQPFMNNYTSTFSTIMVPTT